VNPARGGLRRGAAVWLLIGAVGIALRGVRWEESYERAQAVLGLVAYDPGHPLYVYGWNAFSIHYYLSAAVLRVWDSPLLVCGARDLLCVWGALLPVYFIGARVARSPWGGHLAAAFILANAHQIFRSYYSINVWPFMFTAGEIGFGWALAVVAAWVWGRWGLGFFLLGAMPVVHIGQMPPALAVGFALGVALLAFGQPGERRRMALGLAAGLALTAAFVALHYAMRVPLPESGPYAAAGDAEEVWRRFTFYEDIHRRPGVPPRFGPFAHSQFALVGLLLLSAGWLWRWRQDGSTESRPFVVLVLYGVACCGAVWIAAAGQGLLGADTPFWLIGWLPYRLPNHAGALLAALAAGVAWRGGARWAAVVALAWLAVAPLGAWVLPEALHQRYVAPAEGPLFLLIGAAFAAANAGMGASAVRYVWVVACAGAWGYVAWNNQFLAAVLAGGVLLGWVPHLFGDHIKKLASTLALPPKQWWGKPHPTVALAVAVVVIGQLAGEWRTREHLPRDAFEMEMKIYFETNARPEEVLLAPFTSINYQEKTGQPVFATFETYLFIPYMRGLAPTIETMLSDAYGIRFGQPWSQDVGVWERRTRAEWVVLGEKYGIGFVLAPADAVVDLEPVLRGEGRVLYRIGAV
jgi:hypothetical protein